MARNTRLVRTLHDIHFMANISDIEHPVTKGLRILKLFDETYKGFWVDPGVKPLYNDK